MLRKTKKGSKLEEGVTHFLIQRIQSKKIDPKTQKISYLVKWVDFSSRENTWESKNKLLEDYQHPQIQRYEANQVAAKLLANALLLEKMLSRCCEVDLLPPKGIEKPKRRGKKDELQIVRVRKNLVEIKRNSLKRHHSGHDFSNSMTQDTVAVESEKAGRRSGEGGSFAMKVRSQG